MATSTGTRLLACAVAPSSSPGGNSCAQEQRTALHHHGFATVHGPHHRAAPSKRSISTESEASGVLLSHGDKRQVVASSDVVAAPHSPGGEPCGSASSAIKQQQQQQQHERTCVECGATQTPQWREGPTGPKTLCNACGVRYNRQRHKRTPHSRTKAKQVAAHDRSPALEGKQPRLRRMRARAVRASSDSADEAEQQDVSAALASISGDGGQLSGCGEACSLGSSQRSCDDVLLSLPQQGHGGSAPEWLLSAGSSPDLEMLQEETEQQTHQQRQGRSLAAYPSGQATMSAGLHAPSSQRQQQPAASNRGAGAASRYPSAAAAIMRDVALRAVGCCPDAASLADTFAGFERMHGGVPELAVQQLMGATEQVAAAAGEAAAADAALAAVRQVKASREQAAEDARERAAAAVNRLKGAMSDLLRHSGGADDNACCCDMGEDESMLLGCHAMLLPMHQACGGGGCEPCPAAAAGMCWEEGDALLESNPLLLCGAGDSGAMLLLLGESSAAAEALDEEDLRRAGRKASSARALGPQHGDPLWQPCPWQKPRQRPKPMQRQPRPPRLLQRHTLPRRRQPLSPPPPPRWESPSGPSTRMRTCEARLSTRLWTFGSMAIMAATLGHAALTADGLLDWCTIGASVFAAYVLADLGTGIYHWSVDNYGDGQTPFVGKQIAAFQGHHQRPWTITRREFCNNVHQVFKPAAFPAGLFLLLSPWTPLWCDSFFSSFIFFIAMSQQFHAWAHMKKSELHGAVIALQDAGVLISRRAHGAHHRAPFEGNYCIVSGLWNDVLDRAHFFRGLERLVVALTGVEPRCWYPPEYEVEVEEQAVVAVAEAAAAV